jgi:hypothetical protein
MPQPQPPTPPPPWVFGKSFAKSKKSKGKGMGKGGKGKGKGKAPVVPKPPAPKLADKPEFDEFRDYSVLVQSLDLAEVKAMVGASADLQAFRCTIKKYADKSLLELFKDFRQVIDTAIFFFKQDKANEGQSHLAIACIEILQNSSLFATRSVDDATQFPANTNLLYLIMLKNCMWFKLGTMKISGSRRCVMDRYRGGRLPGGLKELEIDWANLEKAVKKTTVLTLDKPEQDLPIHAELRRIAKEFELPMSKNHTVEFHHLSLLSNAMQLMDLANSTTPETLTAPVCSPGKMKKVSDVKKVVKTVGKVKKVGGKRKEVVGSNLPFDWLK